MKLISTDKEIQNLINWYPGHMAKSFKELKELASLANLFIIVLDARCPISSYNSDFDLISPQKPRLYIINKSDLMDKAKKDQINNFYKDKNLLWVSLRKQSSKKIIFNKINEIFKDKIKKDKEKGLLQTRIKAFVVGVPNSGKSTLINFLSSKNSLKVANMPGVTKANKWTTKDNYFFLDTPGILLPKFKDQEIAIKLIAINSIRNEIFSSKFLASQLFRLLSKYYPNVLTNLNLKPCYSEEEILANFEEYARMHNFYLKEKNLDLNKAYIKFINFVQNLSGVTYD
ncbi:ribosome biogenesis GTPase YlqF [Mycoplasmopsis synoviae]|uniref:ribosome biogenesis GTPase YlqF n=1 Tax=Mycoplasmopsis synoviae TaxID=2109 RepID=UPI001CE1D271|nr:ribosome biogenesis GTPase YlqF [Mycoplasmopsis synoviae]UBX97605.1 ribosome biogenesis GTPase YlqF [Mycoplasmopsis synoviae]UBX98290.1 ribosome biogenesis GTPase YlqF [Mycoplasmopsis synoviae]